ncbi:hypothetical protein RZS28_17130 [Methylocapsa polymorpha]|uniref:Sulfotransferase family protein n=1 Tax=Methylocapsa polymorpha TaxID=3080828 RepID=A0ABZ0HS66_9HYPH|nr:hypothetical protein RZS28_17130 [Methylocapsa sp. RX1]
MPDVVVVLGMHRSGTSSVAGALTKLGGAEPAHLMAANSGNARGYFESIPFMHFHDELLASAGSYWHDWRKFNPSWYRSPALDSYKRRAKEIFASEFGNAPLPILKDPRICRFAPFWLDVLKEMDATPRIVIPIRSPLDVAVSLRRVHNISLTKGLLLWLRHVLDAEVQTRSIARSIFTWDQFLSDWRRVSDKVSLDTGLFWPRLSDRSAQEVEQFLSSELVHHKTDHAELIAHSDVHEWTARAYEALLELACDPFSNSANERLDEIGELFEQSCAMFGRVLADYESSLEELQEQANGRRSENELLRVQHGELRAELAAVCDEQERLLAESQTREQAMLAVSDLHADLISRLERTEAQLAEATREKDELSTSLMSRTVQLAAIQDEMDRLSERSRAERLDLVDVTALLFDRTKRLEQAETQLIETKSKHEEALEKNIEAAMLLERTRAEKDEIVAVHMAVLVQADTSRQADAIALNATIAAKENVEAELARLEKTAAETKNKFEAQIRALCDQLIDAEAASAKSCAMHQSRAAWRKILPPTSGLRRFERKLLGSGLFDADWYKSEYQDVAESGRPPARHYLDEGYLHGYRPNPFFDTRWYLERYEDVRRSGMNPLLHYIMHGYREGRDPGPDFQTNFYLVTYPDVRSRGLNPLAHYLLHGRAEGRLPVRPTGTM